MRCRVYHDGCHYIAIAPGKRPYANWKPRPKKDHEKAFRELYRGTKMGYRQETENGVEYVPGMTGNEQKQYILETLQDTFGDAVDDWQEFVNQEFERERNNYCARAKRFRRKAFFNDWNYFVTFTYDDVKATEETFKQRLRRSLSNLHSRRDWTYMGCFERAEDTGRLHFHGLFHVPPGEMVGEIEERESYSTKQHKMQISCVNTWFEKRFGRNDFCPFTNDDIKRGTTLEYILKYIEKSGERIVYSRGIPSDEVANIAVEQCAAEYYNFVKKWILFDDWKTVDPAPRGVVEGEEAVEWLICFTGYEYENLSRYSP
ncbi:MAG: hypothetical protein E7585_01765 [Ruminococcaceae bacterium]|nr:hypothetical protein [Oscillospiraceae bacterium]